MSEGSYFLHIFFNTFTYVYFHFFQCCAPFIWSRHFIYFKCDLLISKSRFFICSLSSWLDILNLGKLLQKNLCMFVIQVKNYTRSKKHQPKPLSVIIYLIKSKLSIPKLGDHSTLLVSFHLKRHMGDFVIQVDCEMKYLNRFIRLSQVWLIF